MTLQCKLIRTIFISKYIFFIMCQLKFLNIQKRKWLNRKIDHNINPQLITNPKKWLHFYPSIILSFYVIILNKNRITQLILLNSGKLDGPMDQIILYRCAPSPAKRRYSLRTNYKFPRGLIEAYHTYLLGFDLIKWCGFWEWKRDQLWKSLYGWNRINLIHNA